MRTPRNPATNNGAAKNPAFWVWRTALICKLALEDGSVFTGTAFGAAGTQTGEVVFNTSMTGYQEIFTDPSYCGQIVTMTFPLIGNYGVNPEDFESSVPHLSGFVIKELPPRPSNFRATASLAEFLTQHGIIGLAGIDTRALTRRIRIHGAVRGVISTEIQSELELVKLAAGSQSMVGANLVERVAPTAMTDWRQPLWSPPQSNGGPMTHSLRAAHPSLPRCHIVAVDCGIKRNILRHCAEHGCRVTVVPAGASANEIQALAPDGLVFGNGPGDPEAVTDTIATIRALLGRFPIFGICLGHQMLALALGAKTYKLKFGHHGANVPVLNHATGQVEITSQNHGFAVDAGSLERVGGAVTHVNLNDGSLEGFVHVDRRAFAVQFHPEASPGPHDAGYLFERFIETVRTRSPITLDTLKHG